MELLNERNQVKDFLREWAKSPVHSITEHIKPLYAQLNPETATAEDVNAVRDSVDFKWPQPIEPQTCEHCLSSAWNMVYVDAVNNPCCGGINICESCLVKALGLIREPVITNTRIPTSLRITYKPTTLTTISTRS